ncbi:MAG TPA: uracil-DNA glycosylase [Terriglobia bacterium]|nr:uracil-DNA glycosylase [Terriglobia bacterium]
MSREEIVKQLEFFRDIGITSLSTEEPSPLMAKPASSPETLSLIREDIGDCQRCKLAPTRFNIVFGSGNINAELVFVGEAPGSDEDEQGLPFVGRAGELLTKIIDTSIEPGRLTRADVYICNILKCRPPNNRNPEPDEVQACNPFLKRQLAVIRPKVVCCLGKFAAQNLLQSEVTISKLRGRFFDVDGMRVIATFHPAYLLRSPDKKREVWEDMKMIGAELQRLRS